MASTSRVLEGPVLSWPGHFFWEWTKNHPARIDIEIAQIAVMTLSGIVAYCGPKRFGSPATLYLSVYSL